MKTGPIIVSFLSLTLAFARFLKDRPRLRFTEFSPPKWAACEGNAKIQAGLLASSSPVIGDAIKAGKLKVEAGVYNLATGKVTLS